jgi:hypothetical protein
MAMNTSKRHNSLPNETPTAGKPKSSGYAEPRPKGASDPGKPNPDVPGDEASQVASTPPGESVEYPSTDVDDESAPHAGGAGENIEYPSESAPLDGL